MVNTINTHNEVNKGKNNKLRNAIITGALATVLVGGGVYLTKDKLFTKYGETKEYVIDSKQNSIIRILKYNVLNDDQKTDGVLCYKLAEFIMKDNNIKNPRALQLGTTIKINMDEINRIIKEHNELKIKKAAEISEDGLDIYEDLKTPETDEEKELQDIVSDNINEEADEELKNAKKINTVSEDFEEMKCKGGEYFGIDISHHNKRLDLNKLLAVNNKKWNSKKPDVRGMSFIYVRAADGLTQDRELKGHTNVIRRYNKNKKVIANKEKIAVGYYHRINMAGTGLEQANLFIKLYKETQGTTGGNSLIPMLDFEGGRLQKVSKVEAKKKALNWLSIIEKETGVTPGLYVTPSIFETYFDGDPRFSAYPLWIATYPNTDSKGKEIGPSPRIKFKTGAVNVANRLKDTPKWIYPACYQSSQQGNLPGTGNWDGYTDIDHTKDISRIISVQNKSDGKWEEIQLESPYKVVKQKAKATVNKSKKNVAKKNAAKKKAKRKIENSSRKNQRKKKK